MSVSGPWRPWLGAVPERDGVRFRTWATAARQGELRLEEWRGHEFIRVKASARLDPEGDGLFSAYVPDARPGDVYRYRLDGRDPMSDPASRFQPLGVHGPSEIIDPSRFEWHDDTWTGIGGRSLRGMVFYELHVGTFSPEGTFAGVEGRLSYLQRLGITAIELMPIADFPGDRNWGYDGAALFAPARCYGRPDDLRRLVDAAHRAGLGVLLDVVYNHFGPDGTYVVAFSPAVVSDRHPSPWGAGVNFDGPGSAGVRRLLIDNALYWVHEYHVDGFRLDATHSMADDSPTHFLQELGVSIHTARPQAPPVVFAEDSRNLARIVTRTKQGGWGLDGVWADDLHHIVHVMLTRESDGYYQDYGGGADELARTLRQGWLYTGQHSRFFDGPRGTDPSAIDSSRIVVALQTHDQVGNRAFGERLHHLMDLASWRAASVLLLLAPQTPLLFMGQEWAASSPFLYFTDHVPALGERVTQGRRHEFRRFARFADRDAYQRIPDPQRAETFERSRLRWDEIDREPHRGILRLYKRLLALRARSGPAEAGLHDRAASTSRDLASGFSRSADVESGFGRTPVEVLDEAQGIIAMRRHDLAAIICLHGPGDAPPRAIPLPSWVAGEILLDTEDPEFCSDPCPSSHLNSPPTVTFHRPGAIVIRSETRAEARSRKPEA